jgi:hypothetical protein
LIPNERPNRREETGPIRFDACGRNVAKAMCTTQVVRGAIELVGGEGTPVPLVYPKPPWEAR